jgi:hypothetical protein
MTLTDRITKPPPSDSRNNGDSDSILICSIIFKSKKYGVEGRKFGAQGIYWVIDGLGFVITSNQSPIVFSVNELNTPEMTQTFTMWHNSGMGLLH